MKHIILITFFFINCSVFAQDSTSAKVIGEKTGFFYGMGLGFYFANDADAVFYSGRPELPNSIEQQLWNQYYIENIETALNAELVTDLDGKLLVEFPYIIEYKPAVQATFSGGYLLKQGFSVIGSIHYSRLKINSYFKVYKNQPAEKEDFDNSVKGIVSAEESRAVFELGLRHIFLRPKKWHPFLEGGGCFVQTEVLNHNMNIAGIKVPFSIREGSVNSNINYGGGSLGLFMNGGVDFPVNERFTGSLGGGFSSYAVPLLDNNEVQRHASVFMRVCFL